MEIDNFATIPYRERMSYLSEEIKRQIEAGRKSQASVSHACKISQGQISKWVTGEQTSITGDQLNALGSALSHSQTDHAKLLAAHLEDERVGNARHLVRIELVGKTEPVGKNRTTTKGERAIEYLTQERLISPEVNDLLIDLAKCLGADLGQSTPKARINYGARNRVSKMDTAGTALAALMQGRPKP